MTTRIILAMKSTAVTTDTTMTPSMMPSKAILKQHGTLINN